jgi:CHAT domain
VDLQRVPAALADLWDDLPTAIGPAWTDLFPAVAQLSSDLATARDDDQRALLARQLVLLFRPFPVVVDVLRAAMTSATREASQTPSALPDWAQACAELYDRVDGPTVLRHIEVHASLRLPVHGRGVVVVGLIEDPRAQGMKLLTTLRVEVELSADDLLIDGGPVRQLLVLPTGDSEPVIYRITAETPGEKILRADLRQAGVVVGGVTFTMTVDAPYDSAAATSATAVAPRPAVPVALGGAYVPPPDLDLRVHLIRRDGQHILRYVLHSPNNTVDHHYQPAGDVVLAGSPEEYRARLMRRVEGLPPDSVADKLRAFGERLYRELLPAQLRAAYQQFRTVVRSFHVTSDEPWIPWELVRPYEDGPVPVDDDFWAAQFDFARWLAGDVGPATRMHIRRLACVEAAQPPGLAALPGATAERRNLATLAADCGIDDVSPSYADASALSRLLLDPEVNLWHVAAHGDIDELHPDESVLILADGSALSPEDLFGARQSAIRSGRPLVFLNACRVAQQGWSLVQLDGWVDAWVRRCRAGAFIGPLWSVGDAPAEMFARTVYDRLRDGHPVGASVRAARAAVRSRYPDNPTWLAYALYAHPNLRVVLGRGPIPAPTANTP